MSVDSFAKIDMSLDDIIKLNKKEKKKAVLAKKSNSNAGKGGNAAQRKKAEAFKIKARYTKTNKGGGQKITGAKKAPGFKTNAAKRVNIARKSRANLTRGGRINAARNKQLTKNQQPNATQQTRRPVKTRGVARGGLGTRISNQQRNQKLKRQQLMNSNRRGLASSRGNRIAGRQAPASSVPRIGTNPLLRSTDVPRTNAPRGRNRQYNRQQRRPAGQQAQRKSSGYFTSNRGKPYSNFNRGQGRRGRGGATPRRNNRSVTMY